MPSSPVPYCLRGSRDTSCGSVTTDTVYLGGDDAEEIAGNGTIVTSTTKTYRAGGLLLGTLIASGGTESLHVPASDGLGSVTLALDTNGNLTAQQLYDPYGNVRYSFGSMPTAKGYTGQQGDSLTGLDYYGARYYDPLVGQFLTPDDVDAAGPNRYGYVGGNPETDTDPSGHTVTDGGSGGGNGWPDWRYKKNPKPRPYYGWEWDIAGFDDYFNKGGRFTDLKNTHNTVDDEYEVEDGVVLAGYFRCHVDRVQTRGSNPTADYDIYQEVHFASPIYSIVVQSPAVPVELYLPRAGTPWDNPSNGRDTGVVRQAYNKGTQASILVVDLSLYYSTRPSNDTMDDLGSRIVYHPYQRGAASSIARVVFIYKGVVVDDYNPLLGGYGPPVYPSNFKAPVAD